MSAVITIATLSACDVSDVYMTKKVYETQAPNVPGSFKNPAILVFTKTNGFRHDSIEAGVLRLKKMAQENENVQRFIEDKTIRKIIVVKGRLVNIVVA